MSSEVWYRKWRPRTFDEVVGQKHVTQTLARAVALDRVAHAYLFCGPRGTGKTSTARILAKAVNCEANRHESDERRQGGSRGQPCDACSSCRAVAEGRALDLIEMDAASNRGIDEIRSLRDKVGYSPNSSRYKVYLIDEVHELTQFAFDALLKTLEEPPPHVIFVLATTEAHKVPETILSRCQRFDFTRIKLAEVVVRLRQIANAEQVEVSDGALELIARRATGSLRDGVNLFEQTVAAQGAVLTEENVRGGAAAIGDQRAAALVETALQRRLAEALNLIAEVRDDGADLRQFTATVVQYLRSVLLVRAGAEGSLALSDEAIAVLRAVAAETPVATVLRLARALTATDFRADPQSPLPLELALIEFIEAPAPVPSAIVQQAAQPGQEEARATSPQALRAAGPRPQVAGAAEKLRSALAPRTGPPPAVPDRPTVAAVRSQDRGAEQPPVAVAPAEALGGSSPSATNPERAGEPLEIHVNGAPTGADPEDALPGPTDEAARPVEVAPAGTGLLSTLDQVQRRFREIYERCGELDRSAARLLNSGGCDIVEIDAAVVTIGLKHPRMVDLAMVPATDSAIRRSVADVLSSEYAVKYIHVPDVPSRLQLLAAEQPSHLLEEALKLGAKPVQRS